MLLLCSEFPELQAGKRLAAVEQLAIKLEEVVLLNVELALLIYLFLVLKGEVLVGLKLCCRFFIGKHFRLYKKVIEKVDEPGIEPGAYCLQSRRDTTTPFTRTYSTELGRPLTLK